MHSDSLRLGLLLPVAMLSQLFLPVVVHAAGAEGDAPASGGLEEIVVTATRREERLQDVPISVVAFDQAKLDQQGIKTIDDLARLSPGFNVQRNGAAYSYNDEFTDINIRGVDSTAGTSTTGIYIDDTPIQTRHIGFGSINAFPALFDLADVEVLRGPQGTSFGAGAEGGTVRFISPEPDLQKSRGYAKADVAYTEHGAPSYEGGAAFGAPLIEDKLAFRVSVSYRNDGGWVDRVGYTLSPNASVQLPTPVYHGVITDANANYQETTTARAALKWQVTDALEIMPSIYFQSLRIHDTAAYWVGISNPQDQQYRNGNAQTNPDYDPLTLSAIRIKWDLGFASLLSNTSFYDRNQHSRSDYTQYLRATWSAIPCFSPLPPPAPQCTVAYQYPNTFPNPGDRGYATFQDDQRNFYQEVRLTSNDKNARFLWSGGLFYSHLSENVPENIIDPTLNQEVINHTNGLDSICVPGDPVFQCPGGVIFQGPLQKIVDKQVAVFGEATFKFTDTFKATVGLRYSNIDYTGSDNSTGPFQAVAINASVSGSDRPVTPKAVFTWQPDHDNLVYASASKGFRPGGPNFPVGAICDPNLQNLGVKQVPNQYSSDNLWSYEIGAKNAFFDHKLELDSSLYYIRWANIQQFIYLSACGEDFTANLGAAKSEGGDIQALYRPITDLTLSFSAAYTDARLTKTSCTGSLAFDAATDACTQGAIVARPVASNGDALLGAPWSFSSSAEYHFPGWGDHVPYLRIDYQYSTAQKSLLSQHDPNNAVFDSTLPGLVDISNLSARAGLRFNGWDVSIYGNNLTNAHPLAYEIRDLYPYPGNPGTGANNLSQTTDNLYFGRGVRPLTFGALATYRF
jgi:iron complex outermembrane recepter protein